MTTTVTITEMHIPREKHVDVHIFPTGLTHAEMMDAIKSGRNNVAFSYPRMPDGSLPVRYVSIAPYSPSSPTR